MPYVTVIQPCPDRRASPAVFRAAFEQERARIWKMVATTDFLYGQGVRAACVRGH